MRTRRVILGILFILPVLAAHYFSLDGSLFTWASALLSTCLWVTLITIVPANFTNPKSRVVASMVLATLLAIYFFAQLISYYLQGSYFNAQFFFHMNLSSLTETWRAYFPLFLLFITWLTSIWLMVWINRGANTGTKSHGLVLVVLLLALVFDPGLRTSSVLAAQSLLYQQEKNLDSIEWEKLQLDRRALERDTDPAIPGKNLVMIFLEGFDNLYTDEAVFPGLTPNILALNAQGWQLENLRQLAGGTGWTMAGLVSSLCGTPLLHEWDFRSNNIMFTEFLDRAVCLPDILRSAGYQQTFMGGASLVFAGKGIFLNQHSFDRVYGRQELAPRLPDPSYIGGWGLFDDSLFDLAVEEFNAYAKEKVPFNLTLLTVDTHHPTGNASRSCPKYSAIDNSILHAVHCTDYLVGHFIERLQANPAYTNTLIVLVSDHLAMRNDAFSLFPPNYNRRLYFNVLNSGLKGSSATSATPMDLAPTILSLMGVKHGSSFLAGKDVTSITEGIRPAESNDAQRLSTIAFINSHYLTTGTISPLKSLVLDAKEYDFKNDIAQVEFSDNKVTFTATGKDPFIILPKFKNSSGGPMIMVITLDVPDETVTSIFYLTARNEQYSFDRARLEKVKPGSNRLVFPLPAKANYGRIKIDPGSIKGEYTIHSIEIQQ